MYLLLYLYTLDIIRKIDIKFLTNKEVSSMQDMICDCLCVYRKDGMCELGIPVITGDRRRRGFCPALSRSSAFKIQGNNSLV